jgi:hypothetical protein
LHYGCLFTLTKSAAPHIHSLTPNNGPEEVGTEFLIEGTNFGDSLAKITVLFNNEDLPGCSIETPHTLIRCTSPPRTGANEVLVKVKVDTQTSEEYPICFF